MIDDYVSFAGTEVINKARTRAYMRSFVPGLSLSPNAGCEDLGAALGEEYHTPQQDDAPWYSPYNTASNEFYGLYPLSIEGIEDSTGQVTVVETTTDGGVPGRRREASRSLRFSALLVAGSDKGKAFGLSWLRDVLKGSGCNEGDCTGDDLCYLAACPDLCYVNDEPDVPVNVPGDVPMTVSPAGWQYDGTATFTTGMAHVVAARPAVSVPLYGLVPDGWYRVSVRASGGSTVVVEVPGTSIRTSVASSATTFRGVTPVDGGALTLEFRATSTVSRLLISSTSTLDVAGVRVWRIPQPTLLVAQSLLSDSQQVSTWSKAGPTIAGLATTLTYSPTLGVNAHSVFSATPGTIPAQSVYLSHTFGGLTVGLRYRATVLARYYENSVASHDSTLLVPGASVYSTNNLNVGSDATWHEVVFTATATRQEVRVANGVDYTPGATSTPLDLYVTYLRVDEVPDATLPTLLVSDQLRTLRMVTTSTGPSVTDEYNSPTAFMCRVEWGMVATKPRSLGDSVPVGRSLPPAYGVVPERVCTNGALVLHNLLTNPSFETNTTSWSGITSTLTNPTSSGPVSGTHVLRATATASGDYGVRTTGVAASAYRVYTVSASVRVSETTAVTSFIESYDGSTYTTLDSESITLQASEGWARLSATAAMPPGTTQVSLRVTATASASGKWFEADAAMITEGYALRPYFDGSSANSVWDGTANASTSTQTAPTPITAIIDPDCPPPPDPPLPPDIPNDCLDTPASWLRYIMPIPAEVTQVSPVSFPELTLTTSGLDARGVRVRFYGDPFNNGVAGIDECNWCGEFWLSYLPANASLTFDAAVQRVTVSMGGSTVEAMNLLYGSDGGPMTWPELSCGVGYLVVVDLDATTTPLIDARLSVTPGY